LESNLALETRKKRIQLLHTKTNWGKIDLAIVFTGILHTEKIIKIKDIVFRFFPASLSQQELLWRDCRKAIDAYLRNRKVLPDRNQ